MTIADYINLTREKVQDVIADAYRYSDTQVVAALDEGYRMLKRIRPSAGYVKGRLPRDGEDISFIAADPDEIVRSSLDRYSWGIAYVAAGKLLENDNSDTQNVQLAAAFQEQGLAVFRT